MADVRKHDWIGCHIVALLFVHIMNVSFPTGQSQRLVAKGGGGLLTSSDGCRIKTIQRERVETGAGGGGEFVTKGGGGRLMEE